MNQPFNVLLTSISKKVPLIQAVKHSLRKLKLKGNVIGGDLNCKCIGKFFVDISWEMPVLENKDIDMFIACCHDLGVKAIIPSRDGELPFFAHNRAKLQKHGITCMISAAQTVETCHDKLSFSRFAIAEGYPAIPSSLDPKELKCKSYVVKEQFGAGSTSIGLNLTLANAKKWAKGLQHPIFQPFIKGDEYSVDVYVNLEGKAVGAIARTRDLVVNGESQVTTSVYFPELERECIKLAECLGIYGHAVMQVLIDEDNKPHIIECNARFGGASTLSLAMGLNSFEWFFLESLKQPLPPFERSPQEKRQIRHAEDFIIPFGIPNKRTKK